MHSIFLSEFNQIQAICNDAMSSFTYNTTFFTNTKVFVVIEEEGKLLFFFKSRFEDQQWIQTNGENYEFEESNSISTICKLEAQLLCKNEIANGTFDSVFVKDTQSFYLTIEYEGQMLYFVRSRWSDTNMNWIQLDFIPDEELIFGHNVGDSYIEYELTTEQAKQFSDNYFWSRFADFSLIELVKMEDQRVFNEGHPLCYSYLTGDQNFYEFCYISTSGTGFFTNSNSDTVSIMLPKYRAVEGGTHFGFLSNYGDSKLVSIAGIDDFEASLIEGKLQKKIAKKSSRLSFEAKQKLNAQKQEAKKATRRSVEAKQKPKVVQFSKAKKQFFLFAQIEELEVC